MKTQLLISMLLFAFELFGCGNFEETRTMAVTGVKDPVITLNGTWKFTMEPPKSFWKNNVDFEKWSNIRVPGECQMQGFAIKHDQPYAYKREVIIPDDYEGKQILLHFYGVYSYARVWVNGHFIREHFGGFTKWSCDITNHVTAGETAILTVEIVDRTDDISYGSGYAKHQIGGILRDVKLAALPKQNFKKLFFETDLDEKYHDSELNVIYELAKNTPAKIKIKLQDADNKQIEELEKDINESAGKLVISVENSKKWNAEHPNLYTIEVTLSENDNQIMKRTEKIGFREVTVDGNKLFVNGQQIKLRGANRHDIHPLLGRMTTPEYDKRDVQLAKEANINFIRTSHYPPSETFLGYCDQYGIYVEDETAVCFVDSLRMESYRTMGPSQSDPEFTKRYLSQLEEMIQNHRNHPCVIIWSIGNESTFGSNFVESYKWVKENDTTRPVIYSYPGQVPDSIINIYDIISIHYPSWQGDIDQFGISIRGFSHDKMPVLFDEWACVAFVNNSELKYDPNVRNFWGQSLDSMWTYTFETDGALGGAIWNMIDETFMLPLDLEGFNEWWGTLDPKVIPAIYKGPCIGYGEWGIIDPWRRKKPELWLTKKAYSPTKIYQKQLTEYKSNESLVIPIHNRFDHTNFSELKITWRYGDKSGELKNVQLLPHEKGDLTIPANNWNPEEKLNLCFFQNDTFLVDEYNLQIGKRGIELPDYEKGHLGIEETNNQFIVSGKDLVFNVNKQSGLLENIKVNENILIKSGPYVNLKFLGRRSSHQLINMQDYSENWKCTDFSFNENNGIATINTKGGYDSISIRFTIEIDENGTFNIDYMIDNMPEDRYIQEVGLNFIVGESFDKLEWERNAYFTSYPEGHIGIPKGEVDLNEKPEMNYREEPDHVWGMDTKGFYYFGIYDELPYTNIVRSLKENIYSYLLETNENAKIEVFSKGNHACRFDKIGQKNILIINEEWDYPKLLWGNYMKLIESDKKFKGKVIMQIN
jgi:beta-galactosidase